MTTDIQAWPDDDGPGPHDIDEAGEVLLGLVPDEADAVEVDDEDAVEVDDEPAPVSLDDRPEAEAADAAEDDVEVSLDVMLRERLHGDDDIEDEEPEVPEARVALDDDEVRPRADDEFLCRSCFLVKLRAQMADAQGSRCRDCAMAFA